jgi:hypothetical protein
VGAVNGAIAVTADAVRVQMRGGGEIRFAPAAQTDIRSNSLAARA